MPDSSSISQHRAVTRVAVAIVESEGKFLVGIRGPDGPLPDYHEFPGGKLNPQESPEQGALRECLEETGLNVTVSETLYECMHDYPHGRVELSFLLCRPTITGQPSALGRFEWRAADELQTLRFPEANGPVLKLLEARRSQC